MSNKKKKDLVNELMGIEDEETDFFDKPIKKKKQKSKEIDLGTYIPDSFVGPIISKEKNKTKEDVDSFITDVTMKMPRIKEEKNPALENYFDTFSKGEKQETKDISYSNDPEKRIENNRKEIKKNKSKSSITLSLLFTIMFISALAYMGYALLFGSMQVNQSEFIINSTLLAILSFCMMMSYSAEKVKKRKKFAFLEGIIMTCFLVFNLLSVTGIIKLPQNTVMHDFTGKSITEALKWAEANNIKVEQTYDDSESTEEYSIIKQSVYPNVLASKIRTVEFTVSSGPDYEKEVVIPSMVGWNIDEAVKTIDTNFLNNVNIEFEINENETKDSVLNQSKSGQMKRNEELTLKVSLGSESSLEPITMIDLKNMTKFKATLWLKRNGIAYNEKSDFSEKIKRNSIISQSTEKGKKIDPKNDKIDLIISKGKKIIVPELSKMDMKQITKWVIENRLKVEFQDRYDLKIKQGKIIEVNQKSKDEIEEGTLIKVVISKGQLKMPKFTDLQTFRDWANKYSISFKEEYEISKEFKKGEIIRFSAEVNDILNPVESIIVYVSSGDTISIPNFVGKTKSECEKICKDTSIQCTFFYAGNSNKDKDIVLSQNKAVGSEVEKNTFVNIGLSSGKTNQNSNVNTGNNKPNNGGSSGSTPKPTTAPTPTPAPQTYTVTIQPNHVSSSDAATSINTVGSYLKGTAPGVIFNIYNQVSNTGRAPGKMHEDSYCQVNRPCTVTQGKSYSIIIVR